MKRKNSSFHQFRARIPKDVLGSARGRVVSIPVGEGFALSAIGPTTNVVSVSLRTREPSEARARQAIAQAHLDAFWKSLRDGPTRLSQRQVVALSGEAYRELIAALEDNPGEPERWDYFHALAAHLPLSDPEETGTGVALLDRVLGRHGLVVDQESNERLVAELRRVLGEAALRLRANAQGDYSPDANARRFPPVEIAARPPPPMADGEVTLTGLVEGWWRENQRTGTKPNTHESYRNTMRYLVAFLGHDDAPRVTPEDIVRFKDHRLNTPSPRTGKPVSPRTVKDADLAGLKSVFNWAVANRRLPSNPAQGITIKLRKAQKLRAKGFTDGEVSALLSACLKVTRTAELPQTYALKRWVPWLLAYTGARVGEMTQLRKRDVRRTGDHWSLLITPEAGNVKDNEAREVPLHPHLVEMGFPEFAATASGEYLFVRPSKETGDVLGPLHGVNNRLREFVRQYVPDPNVEPNHGWRHLFVTRSRAFGVDLELRRMITGHAGEGVDEREYGDPAGLYRELCKLPRFEVE